MIVYQHGTFWRPECDAPRIATENPEPIPQPLLPPDPWWFGKRLPCGFCTCVFGITPTDAYLTDYLSYETRDRSPRLMLSVLCPECHLLNRVGETDVEEPDPFEPADADEAEETEEEDTEGFP